MNEQPDIRYYQHEEIDKSKWDRCINNADNGLVYAYSSYLDAMAKHWDALILNDYDAVMPLTWNKKYSIYYLYQPFLTSQLGVFGKNIDEKIFNAFLNAVPKKFRYWDISFNHSNIFPLQNFNLHLRSNYILDLNKQYAELYDGYNENTQRNIKKAEQTGCSIQKDLAIEKVTDLAWQQVKALSKWPSDNMKQFKKLYQHFHQQQKAITYGVFSLKNDLLSSCVLFFSHNRIYYILVGNHPDGKNVGASHALIDAIIKDHAGKKLLLDFEGSDIPGLAFFYKGFGAVEEKYSAIKLNRLPFYLKLLKK